MTRKEIRRKVEENKKEDETFRMIATQVYIFLFGICVGWAILFFSKFWWLPILDLVLLIVARKLIHIADAKKYNCLKHKENNNKKGYGGY